MLNILGIIIAIVIVIIVLRERELQIALVSSFVGGWLIIANWPLDNWWNWLFGAVGVLLIISAIAAIKRLIRG